MVLIGAADLEGSEQRSVIGIFFEDFFFGGGFVKLFGFAVAALEET